MNTTQNKPPFVPKYITQNKYQNPNNEENELLKNKLFLDFTEGNFLKIKDNILKNNMITNIRDENNNNILHTIISDENLSENQKIELINIVLPNIDVSLSNKYNVTPLHLACQKQYKNIVNLLLKNGAEINKTDSYGKSVLHYAVTGKDIICPTPKNNKVQPITKKKEEKIDTILKELKILINKIFVGNYDEIVSVNLRHLKSYLEDYKNIFPDEDKKNQENIQKIISDVLSDTNIPINNKTQILFQKILSERDNIYKNFENLINHENVVNLTIQSNPKNDWTPINDTNKINKIMKLHDINIIISDITKENNNLKIKNENTINNVFNELNDRINKIKLCHNQISSSIINIQYYINFLSFGSITIKNKYSNLVKNNLTDIIFPEINYDNNKHSFSTNINDPHDSEQKFIIGEKIDESNTFYTYGEILHILNIVYDSDFIQRGGNRVVNNEENNGVNNEENEDTFVNDDSDSEEENEEDENEENEEENEEDEEKEKINFIINNLNIDYNYLVNTIANYLKINNIDISLQNIINLFENYINIKNQDSKKGEKFEDKIFMKLSVEKKMNNSIQLFNLYLELNYKFDPYNFFNKLHNITSLKLGFYLWRMEIVMNNIDKLKNDIIDNINTQNYDAFFNSNLSNLIIQIINGGILCEYINTIYDEITTMQLQIDSIFKETLSFTKKKLSTIIDDKIDESQNKNLIFKNTYNLISWMFENINIHVKKIKEQNLYLENMGELYNIYFIQIYDWLNNVKTYIANDSATKVFIQYHKYNINDTFIDEISNFISHNFININQQLPRTYQNFISNFSIASKNIYIENYIPKINKNYPITYFYNSQDNLHNNNDFKNGYLIDETLAKNMALEMGKIKVNEAVINNKYDTINFDQNIGFPILFSILGKYHIGFLKYQILETKLNELYDIINSSNPIGDNIKDDIRLKVKEFEASIKNYKKDENDNNPILVIIGNYMKNLIDKYISDLIFRSSNKTILSYINQRMYPKFYKKISEDITPNSEILAQKIQSYVLNLSDIYDKFFANNLDNSDLKNMGKISQGDLVEKFENKNKYLHKILNSNYHSLNSLNQICFYIDDDIIDILANYRADMNIKDRNGQSPLFTAINTKNIKIIDKLIKNNSSVLQQDKNGNTPLKYAIDSYIKSIDTDYNNIYNVCDNLTENIFKEFNEKYFGNLPKNANIIFSVSLHMLNHHFLTLAEKYYGNWNNQLFENLKNILLSMNIDFNSSLPLLNVKLEPEDFGYLNIFNQKIKQDDTNIKKIELEIAQLNSIISNLNGEKIYINKKKLPLKQYYVNRLNYIDNEIINNNNKIATLQQNLQNLTQTKNNLFTENNKDFNIQYNKLQKNIAHLKYSDNVVQLYDYAFINVINYSKKNRLNNNIYDFDADYMTFSNLWKKYISNIKNKNLDYTSFIELMNIYQQQILLNANLNINDKINKLNPIFEFYSRIIFPYIKNYSDLPKEYNTINHCLDTILNIIVHILKRFILVTFYYEICANIQSYLEETFKDAENSNIVKEYFRNILADRYGENQGTKLTDYIFGIMPLKLTKKILEIYEGDNDGDNDPDKNDLSYDSLFDNIIQILNTNTTMSFDKDALINNIKNDVFPRQKEYIRLAVENMYSLMNNYLFYLYEHSQDINIIKKLIPN